MNLNLIAKVPSPGIGHQNKLENHLFILFLVVAVQLQG